MLLLPLCLILKNFSAFLFIFRQNFLIPWKPLVALQYILQIVCRLMNADTECCHFTKSFYICIHVYAESLFLSFIFSEMSLIYGTQDTRTSRIQKVSISEKSCPIYIYAFRRKTTGGGRGGVTKTKNPTKQTEKRALIPS